MSHHKRYADADDTALSLSLISAKLSAMDERTDARLGSVETRLGSVETRLDSVETRLGSVETRLISLEAGQAAHSDQMSELRSMLVKVLDGQSVLLQNDMELKRRFDSLKIG